MDCLIGYGSDDENDSERYGSHQASVVAVASSGPRRREDDTNYDDVNMDLSEDSQGAESEPELPPAQPSPPPQHSRDNRRGSNDSRERDRERNRDSDRDRNRDPDRRDRRRESPPRSRPDRDRADRRSPRRDDRYRSDRDRAGGRSEPRRGLLGDRPDEKVPALMDLKPFGGDLPTPVDKRSQDARDAVSPRFVDRDRRDKDRERDRDRHSRRSEETRSSSHRHDRRERSRSRSRGAPHSGHSSGSGERRSPPSGDYRPSSYKVNKKLEVMEKMGLQIKTPDGSMATAQQLRAAAHDAPPTKSGGLPSYYNPSAVNASKILDQVQKRKLLWGNKNKSEAEEAAKWSGTRFAQDSDGKQVSKFMRLMGIKDSAPVNDTPDKTADPIKKQEDLFQAMQAQYEVARATTHTMRGVGLGFQRGQY